MITIEQLERCIKGANINYDRSENSLLLKMSSSKYNFQNTVYLKVDEDKYVDVICFAFDFKEVTSSVLNLVNEFNRVYRFFSFCIDEDNSLLLKATAIVKENNSIDEVVELMARGCQIMDQIYPEVQKVMWR